MIAAVSISYPNSRLEIRDQPPPPRRRGSFTCAATTSPSTTTLYDVLGLHAGATAREIKAAYRRLARERHPDVAPKGESAAEFIQIHSAYATLSDPDKRADYDREMAIGRLRAPSRSAPASRSPTRTWETDQCW